MCMIFACDIHSFNRILNLSFMQKLVCLGIVFLVSLNLKPVAAQPGPPVREYYISGDVADSAAMKTITEGTVYLADPETSEPYQYKLLDSTGKFEFKVTNTGFYQIQVAAKGYAKYKSTPFSVEGENDRIYLGTIVLIPASGEIGEVNIVIDKPLIENKADRLVYNASADLSSKGGSASDMLRKVPMVEVDLDGNVSIRGSANIRVLINGKPSGIVNAGVRDALRTIPADEIESIEVITNPSAKYDAEGTAGIINIVMKDSKLKGTSGNIHAGAGNRTGHMGAGISRQKGKTGLSMRLGGFYWRNVGSGNTDRSNTIDSNIFYLNQISDNRVFGAGPRLSLGMDHTMNKHNSFSIAGTIRGNINRTKSDWETLTGVNSYPLQLVYGRNTLNRTLTLGYDITADWRKTFDKKGRELTTSAMYNGNSQSTVYDAVQTNQLGIENYKEKSDNLGLNHEFTFQTDFVEPMGKKTILETGLKAIIRKVTSTYYFDSFNFSNETYNTITARSNDFYYNQNVAGGYLQALYNINSKYSVRVGGRYEFTTYGGGREDSALTFTGKPYGNLIPFVNINRVFGYTGFLRFNYTKRLLRPSLFYLNPYTNQSDPRNLTTGNIYLRAEVADNFELSGGNYGKKGGGSLTAYYRSTGNAIESVRTVDTAGVYQTTYGNVGLNRTMGVDMNANLKGKMWMVNINGGLGYVEIESLQQTGVVGGVKNTGITYSASLWGFYKFTPRWSVESFVRINAPTFSLQGRTQNWYFHTIGIKRRFKKDQGGIGIGVDNPFTPHITYTTIQTGKDFSFNDVREINMLGIRLNFDYKFGKLETESYQKPKKGIKNDDLKPGGNDQGGGIGGS